MKANNETKRVAIIGGGPSALFLYKKLIASGRNDFEVDIFEKKSQLGAGMPYSDQGANTEHVTNVSDNEIPPIVTSIEEWVRTAPPKILERFNITDENFNQYKVLPRLLFGQYLSAQFDLLLDLGKKAGITTRVHYQTTVTDIYDQPEEDKVDITLNAQQILAFDKVIICTGHHWPKKFEGSIPGYFDSPYPPSKLVLQLNHPVAIKGSSLTAIDAIRTLARQNGAFSYDANGKLSYTLTKSSPDFKMVMHSRSGMLPAVRFHLENSHLINDAILTADEIREHRNGNSGFLSLDFVFQKNFKDCFREKEPEFYERIKHMNIEQFVAEMMELRERLDPFQLFKAEYLEAEKSIRRHESVYWKEMLAVLSFAMNYPAKYLSAEDMQRLQKVLMPLISIVIAFVPQKSCIELLALHDAGILDIVAVGADSEVKPSREGGVVYHFRDADGHQQSDYYKTFVDCVGQPHLSFEAFPFKGLLTQHAISRAQLRFKSSQEGAKAMSAGEQPVEQDANGNYFLNVSGIAINDNFEIVDRYGAYNSRIYIMAVPYIGGFNPDYSGLDFCEAASLKIANSLFAEA